MTKTETRETEAVAERRAETAQRRELGTQPQEEGEERNAGVTGRQYDLTPLYSMQRSIFHKFGAKTVREPQQDHRQLHQETESSRTPGEIIYSRRPRKEPMPMPQ